MDKKHVDFFINKGDKEWHATNDLVVILQNVLVVILQNVLTVEDLPLVDGVRRNLVIMNVLLCFRNVDTSVFWDQANPFLSVKKERVRLVSMGFMQPMEELVNGNTDLLHLEPSD